MIIPFTKAHGTGNDFIIVYNEDLSSITLDAPLIKRLCNRRTGVGADGLILISKHKSYDFKMDYYNNDGTWETMCANGARCAVLDVYQKQSTGQHISFLAGDGPHHATIKNDDSVELTMKAPKYKTRTLSIHGYSGRHVDSGAKHFAVQVDDLSSIDAFDLGKKIRHSPVFKPHGVNVNFFTIISPRNINVKTYEKGVEQLMQSCGSGSVAAAYHASSLIELKSPLTVNVPGGKLTITFNLDWTEVSLAGPAKILFRSSVELKHLN